MYSLTFRFLERDPSFGLFPSGVPAKGARSKIIKELEVLKLSNLVMEDTLRQVILVCNQFDLSAFLAGVHIASVLICIDRG